MIENTDTEQVERLNARVSELLRERDVLRAAMIQIAAECHRAKWEFDLNEDYKPTAAVARGLIISAFNVLHNIGDLALKARDALASDPQPVAPITTEQLDQLQFGRSCPQPAAPLSAREEIARIIAGGIYAPLRMKAALAKADAILALSPQERGEPVAWRWRPRGAINWIYDPTAKWRAQQKGADIDIEPLYAATALVSDRAAVIEDCAKAAHDDAKEDSGS